MDWTAVSERISRTSCFAKHNEADRCLHHVPTEDGDKVMQHAFCMKLQLSITGL